MGLNPDKVDFFFQLTSFQPHYGPGVDSASYRNEYQEFSCGHKGQLAHMADSLNSHL
jgi:hypothetical protein